MDSQDHAAVRPKHKQHLRTSMERYERKRMQRARMRAGAWLPVPPLWLSAVVIVASSLTAFGALQAEMIQQAVTQVVHRAQSGNAHLEKELRLSLAARGIAPLPPIPPPHPDKVRLGEALFFDKLLSGNKDISCAGCHHPTLHSTDALPLSIGTGGMSLGPRRERGIDKPYIPRHAPDLFNRGYPEFTTLMWDGRIHGTLAEGMTIPEVEAPLANLEHVLAAQVMATVLNPDEMRGHPGESAFDGTRNELAPVEDPQVVWRDLMERITANETYVRLFERAYPSKEPFQLRFTDAANAIAAFEIAHFTFTNSPWDRYVAGDDLALTDSQKQGALLFFGKANCTSCHAGAFFTDQRAHNIAAPQLLPLGPTSPLDEGRASVTGREADRYAFRTPPLRNVAVTAPYLHSGAYDSLRAVIEHHLDPATSLAAYDSSHLRADYQLLVKNDAATQAALLANLAPQLEAPLALSAVEIGQLVDFLGALTDPRAANLERYVPDPPEVPSKLSTKY